MIKEVRKRTGELERFNPLKIQNAIEKAQIAIDSKDSKKSKKFTLDVIKSLESSKIKIPEIEQIQDTVEDVLEKNDARLFKVYSLYRRSRHHAREIKKYFKIKDDLKLSVNALKVLEERYLLKDSKGNIIETPTEMFRRVAKSIASNKKQQEKFFNAMKNLEFLPNSPTLMNAGTKLGQLSACFVLPIEDSLDSIFKTLDDMAIIQQCLTGDTLVMTNDGMTRLDSVNSKNMIITEEGPFEISQVHKKGIENIYEVTSERGFSIKGTAEHRFLVMDENGELIWKRISELEENDWITLNNGKWFGNQDILPKFIFEVKQGRNKTSFKPRLYELPTQITPELAELIGLFLGDGSWHRDGLRFAVSRKEKDLCDRILNLSEKLFKRHITICKTNSSIYEVSILSKQIKEWLKFLGVEKGKIPKIILRSSERNICAFLRGLYSTDGCIREKGYINFSSEFKKFVKDLQIMLLHLGIPTKFYINKRIGFGKESELYMLEVCTKSGFINFKEKIGFSSEFKQNRLEHVNDNNIFNKKDYIPNQRFILRSVYNGLNIQQKEEFKHLFNDIMYKSGRQLTRQKLIQLEKFIDTKELFTENLIFDKVKKIKYAGKEEVYDLTIPLKHSYVANGFVTHNSGGGTGFSFSKIRPKGDIVKSTKGVASGPVSFMRIYDATTETIKQGGKRRGANMGILSVNHPDIIEFINSKQNKKLSNFNISVSATDNFLKKAEKNQNFNLINPRNNHVERKLNAKQVFDLIIQNSHSTGDPGMVFIDEINRKHPLKGLGKIEATNPCIAEGSLISTNEGLIPIEKVHNPFHVSTTNGLNPVKWAGETGIKAVFSIKTNAGFEINATTDHKILTEHGWKEVRELTKEDRLVLGKCPFGNLKISKEEALSLGWLIGDGHITKNLKRAIFFFNKEDKNEMIPLIKPYLDKLNGSNIKILERNSELSIKYSSKVSKHFLDYGLKYQKAKDKEIPLSVFRMNKDSIKSILSALFGADGSVQGNKEKGISIRLASSSLKLLKQTQLLLLQFNILSKVYENRRKAGKRILPDSKRNPKEFDCNADHELIISRESAFRFMEEIGFSVKAKQEKFEIIKPSKVYKDNMDLSVKDVKKIGLMKVYDITEPRTHSFVANGLIVHNCGEQPLLPYESCNLGSINLTKIINKGKIDWNKLSYLVQLSVNFLDNVIDKNHYPLKEIEKLTKTNRKIGLGVMGFADMLMMLKIPYDGKDAMKIGEKIIKFIYKEARKKSQEIAKQKGSFPNIKHSKFNKMRNSTVLTIAPTGTISIIAGCSSGIEPLFALAFFREVLENKRLAEINSIFQTELIKRNLWNEKTIREIMKTGSIKQTKLPKDMKRIFITALEIPPEQHVKMQAVFQKHVDNAVSKTVNLPENATKEQVKKVYLLAWKLKCKGITIYRYGSKEKQVLYKGAAGLIAKPQFSQSCPTGTCQL